MKDAARLFFLVVAFETATLAILQIANAQVVPHHDHEHEASDAEVLAAEVYRRGNLVEDTETIYESPAQWAAQQVTSVPPDDSHKWFISIVTQPGCQPCERLKADFIRSPYLNCWANPTDREASWSHYTVYSSADETQKSRFSKIRITGYPTILIQPPRSAQFGPPTTVVFQRTGYDGNPEKLGADIRSALTRFVEKHYQPRYRDEEVATPEKLEEDPSGHAQAPPFPTPQPTNPVPAVFPPDQHVNIPPPVPDQDGRDGNPTTPREPGPVLPWVLAGVALSFALWPGVRALATRTREAIVSDLAKELKPAQRRSARK